MILLKHIVWILLKFIKKFYRKKQNNLGKPYQTTQWDSWLDCKNEVYLLEKEQDEILFSSLRIEIQVAFKRNIEN